MISGVSRTRTLRRVLQLKVKSKSLWDDPKLSDSGKYWMTKAGGIFFFINLFTFYESLHGWKTSEY
jgi:hypothetical protein